jgi:YD repeat-containing protein
MDYECNRAGDTTESTATIRLVSGTDQIAQTRIAVTEYDSLGRVTKTGQLQAGDRTITSYDAAGRVAQTKQLITGTTEAVTDYAYDHAGHLRTETLPDPDAAGSGQLSLTRFGGLMFPHFWTRLAEQADRGLTPPTTSELVLLGRALES